MAIFYLKGNEGRSLLALGSEKTFVFRDQELASIDAFLDRKDWVFLCLNYDLKTRLHGLPSNNTDLSAFPLAVFVVPEVVVELTAEGVKTLKGIPNAEQQATLDRILEATFAFTPLPATLQARTSKAAYLEHVHQLKDELQYGNIYEINYCQEFYANDCTINDEISFFKNLDALTETPFSAYVKLENHSVFCASPERYLKKTGQHLISQPIKGTIKRGKTEAEDQALIEQLRNDPKERSENVMIVDLVRNDLSILATKGSVNVDELFGIYSFKTVHQMISTISCDMKENTLFTDILKATFPMGSMTGAPKISAMQLIEQHEDFKRGLYSGSIGYIDPEGNFDLNVVIRSIIANRAKRTLSCAVGSAITINAIPENEYSECEVKIHSFLDQLRPEA